MEAAETKLPADIYDEEFYNNLQLARQLIANIKNKKDKAICRKWITKLCQLKSDDAIVKKNRNTFFRFMLQILNKAAKEGAANLDYDSGDHKKEGLHFMSKWSADNRTYIAVQPLPGQGAMVYMAVSSDPKLGWEHPSEN